MYFPQIIHNKVYKTILAEEDMDRFRALYPPIKKTLVLKPENCESRKRKMEENSSESKKSKKD